MLISQNLLQIPRKGILIGFAKLEAVGFDRFLLPRLGTHILTVQELAVADGMSQIEIA
jgi:hypothetical protein